PAVAVTRLNGSAVLYDGLERVEALKGIGRATVEAESTEASREAEVRWLALDAISRHGLPLKPAEKRERFRSYIRAGKNRSGRRVKSYREIASELREPVTTLHR